LFRKKFTISYRFLFRHCAIILKSSIGLIVVGLRYEWGDSFGIMTVKEAAQRWGVTPRRVGEYIRNKRITGAYKIGTAWVMPDDTQKPPSLKSGRKVSNNRKQG